LDSDSNTVTSGTPLEDGIQRLADTASECSEAPGAGAAYFHSKNEVSEEERQERANSGKKYGPPIPFPLVDEECQQRQRLFENHLTAQVMDPNPEQSPVGLHPLPGRDQMAFIHHQNHLTLQQVQTKVINGRQSFSPDDVVKDTKNDVLDFREFYHKNHSENSNDDNNQNIYMEEYQDEGDDDDDEDDDERGSLFEQEDVLPQEDELNPNEGEQVVNEVCCLL